MSDGGEQKSELSRVCMFNFAISDLCTRILLFVVKSFNLRSKKRLTGSSLIRSSRDPAVKISLVSDPNVTVAMDRYSMSCSRKQVVIRWIFGAML